MGGIDPAMPLGGKGPFHSTFRVPEGLFTTGCCGVSVTISVVVQLARVRIPSRRVVFMMSERR